MDIKLFFGIASVIVAIIGFFPYFKDLLKGRTQPHAYSWLVWFILQAISVVAQFKDGGGYGVWALMVGTFISFSVFLLSFKYGTKNITKFDFYCLVAAFISIVFYLSLENPLWSIIMITIIDIFGFLPTFRKGFMEPESETVVLFFLSAVANFLSIIALQHYSLITTMYMASLVITNGAFVVMILVRRRSIESRINL